MIKKCSFCGRTGNSIRFKSGYVCEECLEYIKKADPDDAGERTECSDRFYEGSEKTIEYTPASGTNPENN